MELVTGGFSALEAEFRGAFARLRKGDPLAPIAVIAPSRRLADRLKELALEAIPEGFAAVSFFNLFSFARAIYDETVAPGFTVVLDDLLPERLLRAILKRHFAGERYLSRAADAPGPLLGAIHELKAGAVKPEVSLEALGSEELGYEDAPKLSEILSLYKRYTDELRRRRIHERADIIRVAVENAPRSAWLGRLKRVLYYGFYDLDQNQLDLLDAVRTRVETTVFFPYVESPEFSYSRDFLKTVIAPKAKVTRPVEARPKPPRISQITASGAHDEVWAAAKEVLRLADEGIPYDRIGVVARSLDAYRDLVEALFRDHKIPYTSSARRSLARDPRVKAARLLFSLDDFDRADVLDLLRSPSFKRAGGDPELWDRASRHLGIGHGADEWRRRLGGAAGKDYEHAAGARAGVRPFVLPAAEVDLFWDAVRSLLQAPAPPAKGWKDYAEWALGRYRMFLEPDPRVEAAIASLGALEGFALEDPREALLDRLTDLSEPAGGKAGVQVLDAMAARGLRFRALILLGMNERVFPRVILEDAFLRDAVRSRFEHRLGNRIPCKRDGHQEERLLHALLRDSAGEIVYCHQRSDEKGRLQIPSEFLPPGKPVQIARRPANRLLDMAFARLTPREASLRTGQGEALGRAIGWDVERLLQAVAFLEAVESRGAPTKYDGLVDGRAYWNLVAEFGLSPSSLEKLAECPQRYFLTRLLDLEELEEPEEEEGLRPVEAGTLYHSILERVYVSGDLDLELREGFARFEETRTIRYPVFWDVEKERIREVLRAYLKSEDLEEFKPKFFEKEIKAELPIAAGGRKTVMFRGYLDRIDVSEDGAFRVVDYKRRRSGKFTWKMETGILKKGVYLQPPLYFLLAAHSLGKTDLSRSKFVYAFIEDALEGGKTELTLDGDFWENRELFDAMLRRVLETIPRGEFVIRTGEHCKYCEVRTACRKSHWPTRFRAGKLAPREGEEE